jgi:hypothetical protein
MRRLRWTATLLFAACGDSTSDAFAAGSEVTGMIADTSGAPSTSTTEAGTTAESPRLDLGLVDLGPNLPPGACFVTDGMDAVGDCRTTAPPDAFEPDVQWSWSGGEVIVTPLVANLTDDNGDASIDLCDVPDVVVVAGSALAGQVVVLDGATGSVHHQFATMVNANVTPAIGDLDGDGVPEIVAGIGLPLGMLSVVAFDNVGAVLWQTEPLWPQDQGGALGIADFDNDGSPEVYADGFILDAAGATVMQAPAQTGWFLGQRNTASVAADLDDDGDLELVLGQSAYHHDGTAVYVEAMVVPGYPQIADLDDDPAPEILVNNDRGITILEHDGTIKVLDARPTDDTGLGAWFRPATVHDFDGDGRSDFAVSSAQSYSVYDRDLVPQWSATVQDGSGWAAGTAFDFLGDGFADAMYADEATLYVFNDVGQPLLQVPRSSKTLIEYPVVADVDNDGSAEIVVVSSSDWNDSQTAPSVQVIRDAEDRWIQARRIWNQHTYHVTNVREDGTIPSFEQPSWSMLGTYRTNAQIEGGEVCVPPVG